MATSAFKSTTNRTPVGSAAGFDDSASSTNKVHRRSRSLSRFSRPIPAYDDAPVSRDRFVNIIRGSGFPEISLDDLALDFSPLIDSVPAERGNGHDPRAGRRGSEIGRWASDTASSSQRRGRSVSRQKSLIGDRKADDFGSARGGRGRSIANSEIPRRRRSVSAVQHQVYDSSESDKNRTHRRSSPGGNKKMASQPKRRASIDRQMERSLRERDLSKSKDGYSSHSSVVTEDEANEACFGNKRENSVQAVNGQKSENCRQDPLVWISSEEKGSRGFSNIVKKLFPDSKGNISETKPTGARKTSKDRKRMSRRLAEEAEKYLEDFIYSVGDTDISSFDEERSDSSSTLGGSTRIRDPICYSDADTYLVAAGSNHLPTEMDGVRLPWLQWETSGNGSAHAIQNEANTSATRKTSMLDPDQDSTSRQSSISHSTCSNYIKEKEECSSKCKAIGVSQRPRFEMEDYVSLQSNENLLQEIWSERKRICSGALLLCSNLS